MRTPFNLPNDPRAHERESQARRDKAGTSPAQVDAVFGHEHERVKMGAKVGSYQAVLTASNVQGMLRRKARLAASEKKASARLHHNVRETPRGSTTAFSSPQWLVKSPAIRSALDGRFEKREPSPHLHRWEDDGGTVPR